MQLRSTLLALPAPLLALLSLHALPVHSTEEIEASSQWPWNLPKHVKYWPEDPPTRRRDLEVIEEHLRLGRNPVGVMKMPADEGAKFYMEYWQFEGNLEQTSFQDIPHLRGREEGDARKIANESIAIPFKPPFALHTNQDWEETGLKRTLQKYNAAAAARATLEKRAFACPTGTADCSAIGYANYCCATDETCFAITDTGLGPVGCCPTGSTCGGSISTCNAPNTACDDSVGGACCIENYICADPIGCVINPSLVVTTAVILTVFTSQSMTVITTTTTSTSSQATSALQTTLPCSSGFQACPIGLGGGCCATDRVCASLSCGLPPGLSSTTTTTTTAIATTASTKTITSASGAPPVRPTSGSSTTTQSTTTLLITGTSCPTGFYACSAYYAGGCCRTGRNCDTTSCPNAESATIVSAGETIIVPIGSAATVTSPTGACATGWASCAASLGGDCCPNGYECGTASCSSVGTSATAVVQKGSPNSGAKTVKGYVKVFVSVLIVGLALL